MVRWSTMACVFILALTVASCATSAPATPQASIQSIFPLTVTDDVQRTVTIEAEPKRIVSLSPSNTELVYALGLQDKLVGVDDYSDYPPEAKQKEKVGGFSKPNIEKVVGLTPDLVLATNIHVKTVVPELEKQGLRVLVIQPPTLANVPGNLELLGKIANQPQAGDRLAAQLRSRIEAVASKTRGVSARPRVFFEIGPDLTTMGPDTFLDDMVTKAGGQNIARDAQGAWPKISSEAVVLKDPEIIILADHGSSRGGVTAEIVRARPGWAVISAVESGRIVLLPDQDVTNRPGPRAVDGLEFIASTLHPELFPR